MNYEIRVTIYNPETEKGFNSDLQFVLLASFYYDKDQYGNGYYVSIKGKEFYENYIDLRYNQEFEPTEKMTWLTHWACNYWSGKNGVYKLKYIAITDLETKE